MAAALKSAARQAVVSDIAHFPLVSLDMAVMQVEGTVQLVFLAPGWEGGPIKALSNQFAGPETAAQLRAVADHLAALDWSGSIVEEVA